MTTQTYKQTSVTVPPGPKEFPGVGSALKFRANPIAFFTHARDTYGDVTHFTMRRQNFYFFAHPDAAQQVLVERASSLNKTPVFKRTLGKALGNGLLLSDGEHHRKQRKLMQPAFHHKRIATYADAMVRRSTALANQWRTGETRNVAEDMSLLTLEIVAETLFGADVQADGMRVGAATTDFMQYYVNRIRAPFPAPDWMQTANNKRGTTSTAIVHEVTERFIRDRRAQGNPDTGDLLSMLMRSADEATGSTMTDEQVRDEALTLFGAGHETTAITMAWTFYLLAQHPDIHDKLREELDRVLQGNAPTLAHIPELKYTDMIVKESMRLYPPAWFIGRYTIADVELGGYQIPKGSYISLSPFVVHHDPRWYPDPYAFRPERFAEGWDKTLPKYAYFPFGGGPRICIGNSFASMEAVLILATIGARYRFTLTDSAPVALEPLITLRPKGGVHLQVEKR